MQVKIRLTTESYGKEVQILSNNYYFTKEELNSFIKSIQSSINRMTNKRIVNAGKQEDASKEMPAL
jgi:hypothetical protein